MRTVLKGACKAYKIDYTKYVQVISFPAFYRLICICRARLRMVIEDDSEVLSTVKCNETETMISLNVENNQRFLIEMIDEETEDGESDR